MGERHVPLALPVFLCPASSVISTLAKPVAHSFCRLVVQQAAGAEHLASLVARPVSQHQLARHELALLDAVEDFPKTLGSFLIAPLQFFFGD